MINTTPMGPGWFIFFEESYGKRIKESPVKIDDKEDIELIKILFTFLENQCGC